MSKPAPTLESMSPRDIDRLARISARAPHVEMSLAFTMVWGIVAAVPSLMFRDWFLVDGNVLSLGRIGVWLVLSAAVSAGLCWIDYRLSHAKVQAAKSDLQHLHAEMKLRDGERV